MACVSKFHRPLTDQQSLVCSLYLQWIEAMSAIQPAWLDKPEGLHSYQAQAPPASLQSFSSTWQQPKKQGEHVQGHLVMHSIFNRGR